MHIWGLRYILLGVALCVGITGCSHNSKHGRGKHGGAASTQGMGEGGGYGSNDMSERDLLAKRKFYFEYDRSEMHGQDIDAVYAHADYLKQNQNRRVRIEGHTDEHGSREYNVALGERRAHTVANVLMSQGVSPNQVAIVS